METVGVKGLKDLRSQKTIGVLETETGARQPGKAD